MHLIKPAPLWLPTCSHILLKNLPVQIFSVFGAVQHQDTTGIPYVHISLISTVVQYQRTPLTGNWRLIMDIFPEVAGDCMFLCYEDKICKGLIDG